MDVPIVISVGSTPSMRQIIYLKPKEIKSSKQVQESDKNSNLASVYEIENQGQTGVNVVECDSNLLNIPIEIIFNLHNKNAKKGITTTASYGQSSSADEVPVSQRESGNPKPARTSRGNAENRSKCLLCQRYVSNTKESGNFEPQKNSKPFSPNSLKSDGQSDESLDKGDRRAHECLLCGRDISRVKEGKTDKGAQPQLKSGSKALLDAQGCNEKQPEKDKQTSDEEEPCIINFPPLAQQIVHKVHSLSWENSDRLLVDETGPTFGEDDSLFQLRSKELFNEVSNISWENSDRVFVHDEELTVDEDELPHVHFQPLTKERGDIDKSDFVSEKSNKSLFFEPLIKASADEEEPDLSRHDSLSHDKQLAHPEIPFDQLIRERVQEDPCISLKMSKTAVVDEEGITFTSVPKKDHTTEPFGEKIQDSTPSTSNQKDVRIEALVLNRSPSISETEAAIRDKASTSSDLSDEFYFHFLKEEDIIIIEEEELPKKKGGVRARLKSYFRRVRHRKIRIPARSTTKTE